MHFEYDYFRAIKIIQRVAKRRISLRLGNKKAPDEPEPLTKNKQKQ